MPEEKEDVQEIHDADSRARSRGPGSGGMLGNQAGGANATPSEMPSICKTQAATLKLAGTAADDFVKKCTGAPANAAERKSAPKLQGMK